MKKREKVEHLVKVVVRKKILNQTYYLIFNRIDNEFPLDPFSAIYNNLAKELREKT